MALRRLLGLIALLVALQWQEPELVKLEDPGPMPEEQIWLIDVDGDGLLDVFDEETGWLYFNPGYGHERLRSPWEGWPATRPGSAR
jgi:hypothetical protein